MRQIAFVEASTSSTRFCLNLLQSDTTKNHHKIIIVLTGLIFLNHLNNFNTINKKIVK